MMELNKQSLLKKKILLIIFFAAILRLWGIWHGYPYSFYPDEAHFVKRTLAFGSGDFNPHWFHKPAFLMYLLFFDYGILFVIGKISGFWNSIADFAVFYIKNPGPFYIVGRVTIVLFSLGSVLMTYFAGTRLSNKRIGLIAALLLAVSFGHVFATKDIKADIPCGFFTITSALFLIGFLKKENFRDVVLSAMFAGIGTATKTYSIVMIVPITIAIAGMGGFLYSKNYMHKMVKIVFCVFIFYLFFFICAPYNFIDPLGRKSTFKKMRSLCHKIELIVSGKKNDKNIIDKNIAENMQNPELSMSVFVKGAVSYLKVLQKGVGLIAFVSAFAGLIFLLVRVNKAQLIGVILFPVLFGFIAIFISPGYSEIRHQVVIYPFVAILAAIMIARVLEFIPDKYAWAVICVLFFPVYGIVLYNIDISGEDTRNFAKRWIEKTIPAETKILINENGPRLNTSEAQLIVSIKKAHGADPKGQFTAHFGKYLEYQLEAAKDKKLIKYEISEIRLPWWQERENDLGVYELNSEFDRDMGNPLRSAGVNQYEYYVKNNYQYVIVQSNEYGSFLNPESKLSINFPSFHSFYSQLFKNGTLIKEFAPKRGRTQGPVVKIFQIR
jgi:hypothetical protein